MNKIIHYSIIILALGISAYFLISPNSADDLDDIKQALPTDTVTTSGSINEQVMKQGSKAVSQIISSFSMDPIKVTRGPCDEENAFYDLETKEITFCDEMIDNLTEYGKTSSDKPDEQKEIAVNGSLFIFLHEVGHAVIDILQLPITGKEEDVADQLATYFLLELNEDKAYTQIMDGAFAFYNFSEQYTEIDEETLAGVHSLDKQRFYNIACRLYGATGEKDIIDSRGLSTERAEGCEDEYNLMKSSLDTLLGRNE